jgi:nitroreductase
MSSFQRAQKIYDAIWQYSSDDVSPDTVRRLISMAVMAPLAHNRQPWPFVVSRAESRTRQTRQRISSAALAVARQQHGKSWELRAATRRPIS